MIELAAILHDVGDHKYTDGYEMLVMCHYFSGTLKRLLLNNFWNLSNTINPRLSRLFTLLKTCRTVATLEKINKMTICNFALLKMLIDWMVIW